MTNEPRVPTRMGDGTFTHLTRSEIRADLVAGSEIAAKRAKVRAAHRRRDRPPARDLRLAAALHRRRRRRGDRAQLRRHRHEDPRDAHPGPAELRAVDGRRPAGALRRRLLAQGRAHDPRLRGPVHARRPALHHRAAAVRRHDQPGPLLQAGRPLRQLERAAAAGQDRRGPGGRGRSDRDGRRRHGQAGRLAVGGRRRRDRLGHHRRLGRPRVPRRAARHEDHPREVPGHGRAARHGRRVRARYARRARVGRQASRRPVAQGPAAAGPGGRRHHVRPGRQHQHRQVAGLEHGARHRPHQAVHGRGRRSPCTPTPAWASAACRCSCTCPPTRSAGRPSPSSNCCTSTGCRWARAIPTGCTTPTRRPRASAVFGQPETWLPVCR